MNKNDPRLDMPIMYQRQREFYRPFAPLDGGGVVTTPVVRFAKDKDQKKPKKAGALAFGAIFVIAIILIFNPMDEAEYFKVSIDSRVFLTQDGTNSLFTKIQTLISSTEYSNAEVKLWLTTRGEDFKKVPPNALDFKKGESSLPFQFDFLCSLDLPSKEQIPTNEIYVCLQIKSKDPKDGSIKTQFAHTKVLK